MGYRVKSCRAYYKASSAELSADAASAGEFTALVSVFNNVDYGLDIVRPGAFADSLREWASSADAMPVLWHHRTDDPDYNIGVVLAAAEVGAGDERIPEHADAHVKANGGLWVHARLDTGPDVSRVALQARRLLMARRVTQFSFAYDIDDYHPRDDGVWELLKLRIYEASITQYGQNDLTELGQAKHDRRVPPAAAQDPPGQAVAYDVTAGIGRSRAMALLTHCQ